MRNMTTSGQRGFGIIEALIAFILIGVGILAMTQFYSDMIGGTSLSKARGEALDLGKQQMAKLRNYATRSNFEAEVVSGTEADVAGKNATFDVAWTITDSEAGNYKDANITVSWVDPQEGDSSVELNSLIYFSDPGLTAGIWAEETGNLSGGDALPSPWITGVEGEVEHEDEGQIIAEDGQETDTSGDDVTLKRYEDGNVEVIDADGNVRLTAFGGIVHRIRGRVIATAEARSTIVDGDADLKLLASPPSYCVFPICYDTDSGGGDHPNDCQIDGRQEAAYVCYVPGDCSESLGEHGCPESLSTTVDLNGGWYGRVGNLSVHLNPDDTVCTADTVVAGGDDLNLTPSREYAAYRIQTGGGAPACSGTGPYYNADTNALEGYCVNGVAHSVLGNEGVNTPYVCQNFVIDRKQSGMNCEAIAAEYGIGRLPPANISRALDTPKDENPNTVRPLVFEASDGYVDYCISSNLPPDGGEGDACPAPGPDPVTYQCYCTYGFNEVTGEHYAAAATSDPVGASFCSVDYCSSWLPYQDLNSGAGGSFEAPACAE